MKVNDRLKALLAEHETLYGIMCRDATAVDVQQIAQVGYHAVWLDVEHSPMGFEQVAKHVQLIDALGMLAMVRVMDASKHQVQNALDAGAHVVVLPQCANGDEARELARLGKYPPAGQRGVATTVAGIGYTLGDDPLAKMAQVNDATHLMVQIENDTGLDQLDDILSVDGVDMITAGPGDWAATLGLWGAGAQGEVGPRVEKVYAAAAQAGKTIATVASDPGIASRHIELGARIVVIGVDTALKRGAFAGALGRFVDDR